MSDGRTYRTMTVELGPELERLVAEKGSSGEYPDHSAVVAHALERLVQPTAKRPSTRDERVAAIQGSKNAEKQSFLAQN